MNQFPQTKTPDKTLQKPLPRPTPKMSIFHGHPPILKGDSVSILRSGHKYFCIDEFPGDRVGQLEKAPSSAIPYARRWSQ